MKRIILVTFFSFVAVFLLTPWTGVGQCQWGGYRGGYGYEMGPGMMWGGQDIDIPSKLATPKNKEWIEKLKEIYSLEKQSLAQYEADQEKYNAYMPYMMVIPQEEDHVRWIGQLFASYSMVADVKVHPVAETKSLKNAYEFCLKMEGDLLPRYEWLVKNAEDRNSAEVLNYILIQSRHHYVMFEHALQMGYGYGYSRDPGIAGGYSYGRGYGMMGGYGRGMGPGMMGGYGYGRGYGMMRGYGYGQPYTQRTKPVDMAEAKTMMEEYLQWFRNPNLKLGKIKDVGSDFEAEILTTGNALVDRMLIDKNTGYFRSAY